MSNGNLQNSQFDEMFILIYKTQAPKAKILYSLLLCRRGKGRSLFLLLHGKGTALFIDLEGIRLFVDVQGKGRDMIFFLFPEHLQTILFPSLYIYKQSCSLSLHNYKQTCSLFPQELRTRSTRFLLWGLISFYLKPKNKNEVGGYFSFIPLFHPLKYRFRLKFLFNTRDEQVFILLVDNLI